MRKYIVLALVIFCVLSLVGCAEGHTPEEPKQELTIDELKVIAEKGEDIWWSDFEPYVQFSEYGSGILNRSYLVEDKYLLTVSGWPDSYISSIRLSTAIKVGESTEGYREIDIRTESIDDFLKEETESPTIP